MKINTNQTLSIQKSLLCTTYTVGFFCSTPLFYSFVLLFYSTLLFFNHNSLYPNFFLLLFRCFLLFLNHSVRQGLVAISISPLISLFLYNKTLFYSFLFFFILFVFVSFCLFVFLSFSHLKFIYTITHHKLIYLLTCLLLIRKALLKTHFFYNKKR